MKVRLTLALLIGTLAILTASTARAGVIRTGSDYGIYSDTETTAGGIGTEWLVPFPGSEFTTGDVLLQILPTSPDLGDPLQVTIDLSGTPFVAGTTTFGLINCGDTTHAGNLGNSGAPCATTASAGEDLGCDIADATVVGDTVTLPGSCDVAGETFYFDEADEVSPTTGEFVGAFADVKALPATGTPEPSSLTLLGLGLIPLALFSRRRVKA